MEKEIRKARKKAIISFIICLLLATASIGGCAYLIYFYRGTGTDGMANVAKILNLTGLFFLIIAFGHILPGIIRGRKNAPIKESDIFQEVNMRWAFEKYIPVGETLLAGIHAIANETSVNLTYRNCISIDNTLEPVKNGQIVEINKTKYSTYDVYIGITQHSLLVTQCAKNKYLYSIEQKADDGNQNIPELTESVLHSELGCCFPLEEIEATKIKKGMLGTLKCDITMKNGSYFKLLLPENGGIGYGMPHHLEYRDIIISRQPITSL